MVMVLFNAQDALLVPLHLMMDQLNAIIALQALSLLRDLVFVILALQVHLQELELLIVSKKI